MSEPEGFLARWSRLKSDGAEAADAEQTAETKARPDAAATEVTDETTTDATQSVAPGLDLSKLPPIESITASTDIRPFLAPGVPLELTRAALRRAWVADPNIRTFIGLAENQWDFNAPETIPGFGTLEPGEDVRRLVAEVFGETSPPPQGDNVAGRAATEPPRQHLAAAEESAAAADSRETPVAAGDDPSALPDKCQPTSPSTSLHDAQEHAATHNKRAGHDLPADHSDHDDVTPRRARRHGGALPE